MIPKAPTKQAGIRTGFERAQRAQLADDALADRVKHRRDLGIGGWVGLHKPWFQSLSCAIDKDPLEEDQVVMEIGIE